MKVKLLQDIIEKDLNGREVGVKTTAHRGEEAIYFYKGVVVEMSPLSAQKYVELGWAEMVEEGVEKQLKPKPTQLPAEPPPARPTQMPAEPTHTKDKPTIKDLKEPHRGTKK